MVAAGAFGSRVPERVKTAVARTQKDVLAGKRKVFAGPLLDNTGKMVLPSGQILSDEAIVTMNYLVRGVETKL